MQAWTAIPLSATACQVQDVQGLHVGNLKLIAGAWKFKAIGYDAQGQLVPGGGPLTDRHNAVLERLDAAALHAALALPPLHYLAFELSLAGEAVSTLEAMASTAAAQHPAVMSEVQRVLDWAWQHFPQGHGPADDGGDWDYDLQVSTEAGGWQVVTLTITGSPRFIEAFGARFGVAQA